MESNDESQDTMEALGTQHRSSRKPLWRVAGATVLIGSLAAGGLAHAYGARLTVMAGGLIAIAAAAVFRMRLQVFREVR